tara:strand:+ start:12510 stop:13493 length:984 start_codon:yes stop_codon:yes gene_type:complete
MSVSGEVLHRSTWLGGGLEPGALHVVKDLDGDNVQDVVVAVKSVSADSILELRAFGSSNGVELWSTPLPWDDSLSPMSVSSDRTGPWLAYGYTPGEAKARSIVQFLHVDTGDPGLSHALPASDRLIGSAAFAGGCRDSTLAVFTLNRDGRSMWSLTPNADRVDAHELIRASAEMPWFGQSVQGLADDTPGGELFAVRSDVVYRISEDGTWTNAKYRGWDFMQTLGDLDGDGRLDLAFGDSYAMDASTRYAGCLHVNLSSGKAPLILQAPPLLTTSGWDMWETVGQDGSFTRRPTNPFRYSGVMAGRERLYVLSFHPLGIHETLEWPR